MLEVTLSLGQEVTVAGFPNLLDEGRWVLCEAGSIVDEGGQ